MSIRVPQRRIPRGATVRVVLASSLTTVLIVGAAVLANARNQRANASQRTALAARADGIATSHALTSYWVEREAMNEYLVLHHRKLLAEVDSQADAFDQALRQNSLASEKERVLISEARTENNLFVATFNREGDAAQSRATTAAILHDIDQRAALVLSPLNRLLLNDATKSRTAQRRAAVATTEARRFAAAAAFVFLIAIVFFSLSAVRLFRRLARQNRELKLLDGLKDDFVASVSHELRTPLTSIRGYVELVLDQETGPLNEEQHRFLAIVNRSSERLLRLVGDLLFIAQLDATSLHLETAPVSLTRLVEEAVDAAQPAAAIKGLELTINTEELPESTGDSARLAQLLDNLISNAIKFTPAGEVTVSLHKQDSTAVIEVTDSGIGIPAAEQQRLFERFYRTSAANLQAIQGTGLGLSIAKAITEGHGGTIEYESVEHAGTTFRVRLPLPNPIAAPPPISALLQEA